jgi:2,4-dienoyl-CoA reductase-like NADH-dependent reductase (Old Yellow Enzyme family)
MRQYRTQRASEGGFIVSEGTTISASAKGWFGAPGIYTDEQVAAWRGITAAVHAKGACIFSQLWHTGRASHIDTSGLTPVSSSVDPNYDVGLSKTIGRLPNERRSPDLTAWNSIPAMAICLISSCRTE